MSIIHRVHVPLLKPDGIIPYLGAPHHWKDGRSAKCLIDQWWTANALPASISTMLGQASEWRGAELIDAFAERCTNLQDGRPSHSQSDMLAIVGLRNEVGIVVIEAKVDEGFDNSVDQWRRGSGRGKAERLARLCALFGIDPAKVGDLRYQLLHRTASAVYEAQRYRSRWAAMIVQSWSPKMDGFADFSQFLSAVGVAHISPGRLSESFTVGGVALRLGWSIESC